MAPEFQLPGAAGPPPIPRPARARSARIICKDNGVGLSRDRAILAEAFLAAGWAVDLCAPDDPGREVVVANVHVEVPDERLFASARRNVIIPNPECWAREWGRCLAAPRTEVWAKTRHAAEIFQGRGAPVRYMGFSSSSAHCRTNPPLREWLHIAGKSVHKGTANIINAWAAHPEWPGITIYAAPELALPLPPPRDNITLRREWLSAAEIAAAQQSRLLHLCPSQAEGFGHYIWEAMSCGAIVATCDWPPMNEAVTPDCGILVRAREAPGPEWPTWGTFCDCGIEGIESAVAQAAALSPADCARLSRAAQNRWAINAAEFSDRIGALIAGLEGASGGK